MSYQEFLTLIQDNLVKSLKSIGPDIRPRKDQEKMVKSIVNDLVTRDEQFPAVVKPIEAPNGAGKAAVIASTALTFSKLGRRVLILEPNYKLISDIQGYIEIISDDYIEIKPFSSFLEIKCEIKVDTVPNASLCKNWKKKCKETSCLVMKHFQESENQKIIFSTHHKMIYDTTLLKDEVSGHFDLIIIDEFHMIPEIIDSYCERTFRPPQLRSKIVSSNLEEEDKNSLIDLINEFQETEDKQAKKSIVNEMYDIITEGDQTKTIFETGSLNISRSSSGFREKRKIKELTLENTQILLFSATSIDSKDLIFNQLKFDGLSVLPIEKFYQSSIERLSRITIVSVTDLPRLDKGDNSNFETTLQVTINYLKNVLIDFHESGVFARHNVMVLCTAKNDAKFINNAIENTPLKDYLIDIDKITREVENKFGIDAPRIATEVGERVIELTKERNRLILVTGSSVFWQGVNLNNVKYLFILNLPYRVPKDSELKEKWKGHWSNTRQFKDMVRRLSQGVGRLCRDEFTDDSHSIQNWGISVILDGRFQSLEKSIIKNFPEVYQNSFTSYDRERLRRGLKQIAKFVNAHNSPYNETGQLLLREFTR